MGRKREIRKACGVKGRDAGLRVSSSSFALCMWRRGQAESWDSGHEGESKDSLRHGIHTHTHTHAEHTNVSLTPNDLFLCLKTRLHLCDWPKMNSLN